MPVVVTKPCTCACSDPILLKAGSVVTWAERESEWEGWAWCRDEAGKEGWVPEAILEKDGDRATVLREYVAAELTVEAGEKLELLSEESGWLWCRNGKGALGWVPKEHIEVIA
jgi:SH3-like domain-containing protein